MQLRTLLLGGAAIAVVYFAASERSPEPAAAAPARPARAAKIELPRWVPQSQPRAIEPIEPIEIVVDDDEDEDEVYDVEDAFEDIDIELPTSLRGLVRDEETREPVIGCTVVVTSSEPEHGPFTAITDETGFWEIRPLPAGRYTITYYYLDLMIESGAMVEENHITALFVDMKTPRYEPIYIPPGEPEPPSDPDALGVVFSSSTLIDNTYVIE